MNQYPYYDAGQTGQGSHNAQQSWGEPASPAGDWAKRAGQAYAAYRFGNQAQDPEPEAFDHAAYMPWLERNVGSMIPGSTGFAGPVRAVKTPIQGGVRTALEYYKDANPQKVLGELSYSKASGQPPVFENIMSNTPRGTGELLEGLQKRLGPMLNDMEITSIQPQAASFWGKLANSSRLDSYPGLRKRIMEGVDQTEQSGITTPNSYNYNPYRNMGFFE